MQAAVNVANSLIGEAKQTLTAAGLVLMRRLDGLRGELGDHRRLINDPDFDVTLGSTLAGLYAAPGKVLGGLTEEARSVRNEASQWARLLRGGTPAQRSQAGSLLKRTAANAKALEGEVDGAQWLGKLPAGVAVGGSLSQVSLLEDLKYAEDIPIVGLGFATMGVGLDHYGLHQSWSEAVTGNVASLGAGIAVGAMVTEGVATGWQPSGSVAS